MRRFACLALALLPLALAGCVPSLHPLYTSKDLVFDPALLGAWRNAEGDTWQVSGAPGEAYEALVTVDGEPRRMELHLVRIGDERFLDCYPTEPDINNSFYAGHLLRIHHFIRIRLKEDAIEAAMLDGDWLAKQLDANRYAVRREKVGEEYVLTAPPAQLQAFLKALLAEKDAFTEPEVYRRVK